jgi:hypothetical protein
MFACSLYCIIRCTETFWSPCSIINILTSWFFAMFPVPAMSFCFINGPNSTSSQRQTPSPPIYKLCDIQARCRVKELRFQYKVKFVFKKSRCKRFVFLTAVLLKVRVFSDLTLCLWAVNSPDSSNVAIRYALSKRWEFSFNCQNSWAFISVLTAIVCALSAQR